MNTFVLTGGKSFVGSHLLSNDPSYIEIKERINCSTDLESIKQKYNLQKDDVIINCIGHTGNPNIDSCEKTEESKKKTYDSNVVVPTLINLFCDLHSIKMIHISSGCIYYGYKEGGWLETDDTTPLSFYSQTKYICEKKLTSNVLVVRIRMPISDLKDNRNLITKLSKYTQLIDAPNSVTFLDDLSTFIKHACLNSLTGIYNVVNDIPLSAADVMNEYKKHIKDHPSFDIISTETLDSITIAKRSNCILNTNKLKSSLFQMSDSKLKLEETIKNYILKDQNVK